MVEIILEDGQNAYSVVAEYIDRYFSKEVVDAVVISIGISCDGIDYYFLNTVADPTFSGSGEDIIEFLDDWWEGQKYIKLIGIKAVSELDISGGIYKSEEES